MIIKKILLMLGIIMTLSFCGCHQHQKDISMQPNVFPTPTLSPMPEEFNIRPSPK